MGGWAEMVLANPIVVKSARSRLRWRHMLSWGTVVVTLTGFTTVVNYLTATERELATPEEAARMTLLPVIIIQAVILMLLGTGAVASGISLERDRGLLDYQRMTPMSPSAKLLGYLFGLPVREYVLFALTMPFALFGIVRGEFPAGTALHFYAIFFSSVLVYHMTGMVAGMASSKPRLAWLFAQGMVVVLYFVLPNLSHLGLTFFEFLTIRPALFGLILEQAERMGGPGAVSMVRELSGLDTFRSIPFFGGRLHPSVYTMLVQGSLLATMWVVVHRKWRDERAHLFSKAFGLVFFAGATAFLVGSVWPILRSDEVLAQLLGHLMRDSAADMAEVLAAEEGPFLVALLLLVSSLVIGAVGVLTLMCTTPTRHRAAEGWRRAARLGRRGVPLAWDASSSAWLCLACAAIGAATIAGLAWMAGSEGRLWTRPTAASVAAPAVFVGLVLLFLQGTLERFGRRVFFVSVFLLWVVPAFVCVLLMAGFEREVDGAYASLACPPMALFFMLMNVLESGASGRGLSDISTTLAAHLPRLVTTALLGYGGLAGAALVASRRQQKALRASAQREAAGLPA